MPLPTWAVGEGSTITGFADSSVKICIARGTLSRATQVVNVTQSGDGASKFGAAKRYVYRLSGTGWYEDSDGNQVYVTGNMGSLSGNTFGRVSRATIIREIEVDDVTASTDPLPDKLFTPKLPIYRGGMSGFLQSTETPLSADNNSDPATITLPLGSGTVSASFIVPGDSISTDMQRGGANPVETQLLLTGAVTTTNTPFAISSYDASLDLDNGQSVTGTVIATMLRCDLNYADGAFVPFTFECLFNGTVTFT